VLERSPPHLSRLAVSMRSRSSLAGSRLDVGRHRRWPHCAAPVPRQSQIVSWEADGCGCRLESSPLAPQGRAWRPPPGARLPVLLNRQPPAPAPLPPADPSLRSAPRSTARATAGALPDQRRPPSSDAESSACGVKFPKCWGRRRAAVRLPVWQRVCDLVVRPKVSCSASAPAAVGRDPEVRPPGPGRPFRPADPQWWIKGRHPAPGFTRGLSGCWRCSSFRKLPPGGNHPWGVGPRARQGGHGSCSVGPWHEY